MLITFDLDDTLLDHSHAARVGARHFLQGHREIFTMPETQFLHLWNDATQEAFDLFVRRQMGFFVARQWRMKKLFAGIGIRLTNASADAMAEDARKQYQAGWRLFPDVRPCLEQLHGTHRLVVITNGSRQQQVKKLDWTGIRPYFDAIFVSETDGAAKPEPIMFQAACRRFETAAEHGVHLGDQWHVDVVGSRMAGMHPVWLNRSKAPVPEGNSGNIAVITSLSELSKIIKSLS